MPQNVKVTSQLTINQLWIIVRRSPRCKWSRSKYIQAPSVIITNLTYVSSIIIKLLIWALLFWQLNSIYFPFKYQTFLPQSKLSCNCAFGTMYKYLYLYTNCQSWPYSRRCSTCLSQCKPVEVQSLHFILYGTFFIA